MYCDEPLCFMEGLELRVVQALHRSAGHSGVDRLYEECQRPYVLPYTRGLKSLCKKVKRACGVCAQVDPPHWRRYGRIDHFPVLVRIWDRVCLDIFSMPEEWHEGQRFDAMLVCVDRHTGWIIAVPTQKTGSQRRRR